MRAAGGDGILESTLMKMVRGRWDKRRHDDIIGQMAAAGVIWREIKTPTGGGRPGMRVGMWREGEREASYAFAKCQDRTRICAPFMT